MKKYEFTGETMRFAGTTLRRIKRLSDERIGGWIESENNLSHEGTCFVYDIAQVYGNARIFNHARVYGNAQVYGDAMVGGNARVFDTAMVYGKAQVSICLYVQQLNHSITITNDYIFIGCQGHSWDYWAHNIEAIGRDAEYSADEIAETEALIEILKKQITRQLTAI